MSPLIKQSHYDPRTRMVHLDDDASLFTAFHEYAHAEQHAKRTVLFVLWQVLHQIRFLGYVVTVLVEWDANRRAKKAMIFNGVWTDEARQESKKKLMTYVLRKNRQLYA